MIDHTLKAKCLQALKDEINSYTDISMETWNQLKTICTFSKLKNKDYFIRAGETPSFFGFVYSGLLRAYIINEKGFEYNKIFFPEKSFPGAMVALLTGMPSNFFIEALEDSDLLYINFKEYRRLLKDHDDLKWFQILYLEKNWVISKEEREVSIVQENATERYRRFKKQYQNLEARIPQYHIASHLGITPTQLSRIRRNIVD